MLLSTVLASADPAPALFLHTTWMKRSLSSMAGCPPRPGWYTRYTSPPRLTADGVDTLAVTSYDWTLYVPWPPRYRNE
jgi:hypothetical protein